MQIISYIFRILKHIQVNSQFRKLLMLKVWLYFLDNLYIYLKKMKKGKELTVSFICVLSRATHIASSVWSSNGSKLYLNNNKLCITQVIIKTHKIGLGQNLAWPFSATGPLNIINKTHWAGLGPTFGHSVLVQLVHSTFVFKINSHFDQKSHLPNTKSCFLPINMHMKIQQRMHPSHLGYVISFHLASVFSQLKKFLKWTLKFPGIYCNFLKLYNINTLKKKRIVHSLALGPSTNQIKIACASQRSKRELFLKKIFKK